MISRSESGRTPASSSSASVTGSARTRAGTARSGRTVRRGSRSSGVGVVLGVLVVARIDRRLVLGPYIAALDAEDAGCVDADEGAGTRDLGCVIKDGPALEGLQRRLDLTEAAVDLLGDLVGLGVGLLKLAELRLQGIAGGYLLVGHGDLRAAEAAQAVGMAIRKVGCDLNPLPPFGTDGLGLAFDLLCNEPLQQGRVLQPAAVVGLEQVAQDDAAGRLVVGDADEPRPSVRGAHRVLGQHPADLVGLPDGDALQCLPHFRLPRVVGIDGECHEVLQGHAVLGVDLVQLRGDGREPQALAHDGNRDEERRGDVLLGLALLAQRQERAELVKGMQRCPLHVLREAVLLGDATDTHDAWDRCGARKTLLLHQQLQRPVTPAAGRHLVHPRLGAALVQHRPNRKALQQRAPGDILGQLLDCHAGLDPAHVGLAEDELVEGNVPQFAQGDLGLRLGHGRVLRFLRDGPGRKNSLPAPQARHEVPIPPLPLDCLLLPEESRRPGDRLRHGGGHVAHFLMVYSPRFCRGDRPAASRRSYRPRWMPRIPQARWPNCSPSLWNVTGWRWQLRYQRPRSQDRPPS